MNSFDVISTRVAHALWAPADKHYLSVAISRLHDLVTVTPELAIEIGISKAELSEFSQLIQAEALNNPSRSPELAVINAPLLDETTNTHPFHGYRQQHAGYVILLTSLPNNHPLKVDCDELTAKLLTQTVKLNLSKTLDEYSETLAKATRMQLMGARLEDEQRQPSSDALIKVCLALRTFVDAASQGRPIDEVLPLCEQFNRQAKSFIKNPEKTRIGRKATSGSKRKGQSKKTPHRDSKSLLNLSAPAQIQVMRQDLHVEEQVEFIHVAIPPKISKKAQENDCSPLELMTEQAIISPKIPQDHSRLSSIAVGRYQAKQLANRNELLRWDVVNLTHHQIQGCLELLIKMSAVKNDLGIASSFLLVSLVTGRSLVNLPGAIWIDPSATKFDESSLSALSDDPSKINVVLLPAMGCLALRVNQPNVVKVRDWNGVIPRSEFVLVPDYLSVSQLMLSQLAGQDIEPELLVNVKKDHIVSAAMRVGLSLKTYGVSATRLWQTLPRLLQSESGMNTAMALLTDWQTSNSVVDLHYHCVEAQKLASRYRASMDALLHYDTKYWVCEKHLPAQKYFVGSPNCISAKKLKVLIDQFENALLDRYDIVQHANLLTLYTLMVMTAGFGFRHAISPKIELHPFRDRMILSYQEKDALRQLVLPKLVQKQLAVYREMRITPIAHGAPKVVGNKLSFFLISPKCLVRPFKPGGFSKELKAYGIEFELELNSMRRWMFSALFNEGVRGIQTDFYGGHGVMGREPLTTFSSTNFDSFIAAADEMDRVLEATGWRVLS